MYIHTPDTPEYLMYFTSHHVLVVFYFTSYPDMGWLHVVDSFKSYVSLAKEPYERDDILQKRPEILRRLLIVATPYTRIY